MRSVVAFASNIVQVGDEQFVIDNGAHLSRSHVVDTI